jgi:hypothetical protein
VLGQLLGQRPLQHRLHHLRKQPIRAEQLNPLRFGLGEELISQLRIDQPGLVLRSLPGHLCSVGHLVVPPEPLDAIQSRALSLT